MASPMRAKRIWEEPEAPSEEAVAFEKAVAALAENIAKPQQTPASAPEDLTDHKLWLEQQFAAIQAGQPVQPPPPHAAPKEHTDPVGITEDAQLETQPDTIASPAPPSEAGGESTRRGLLDWHRTKDLLLAGQAWCTAKARMVTQTSSAFLATHGPEMTARSAALLNDCKDAFSRASSWSKRKAEAFAPPLYARVTTLGSEAWSRAKDTDARQRLLIAGAVMLLIGGLVIGGSLLQRAGTPTADQDPVGPIAWAFEAADGPLADRSVFALAGTPQDTRIKGLLIRAENISDDPLASVEGVIRPDTQQSDLKLTLDADPSTQDPKEVDIEITSSVVDDTIPAQAPFHLAYTFPGEGLSAEKFIDTYGGLTLNVRFEVDGKQRAVIQYLSPEMLRAQLDEIGAAGS